MKRPGRLLVIGIALMALSTTLAVTELNDRDRYGTASAVAQLPESVNGFGGPVQLGRCVVMRGSRDGIDLLWRACDAALPLAYLAEREVSRATEVENGVYFPQPTVQTLPPGTAVYLNCGNLRDDCADHESLLVGRRGRGEWDITAYLAADRSPTEWTSPSEWEEKALAIMISLWQA